MGEQNIDIDICRPWEWIWQQFRVLLVMQMSI